MAVTGCQHQRVRIAAPVSRLGWCVCGPQRTRRAASSARLWPCVRPACVPQRARHGPRRRGHRPRAPPAPWSLPVPPGGAPGGAGAGLRPCARAPVAPFASLPVVSSRSEPLWALTARAAAAPRLLAPPVPAGAGGGRPCAGWRARSAAPLGRRRRLACSTRPRARALHRRPRRWGHTASTGCPTSRSQRATTASSSSRSSCGATTAGCAAASSATAAQSSGPSQPRRPPPMQARTRRSWCACATTATGRGRWSRPRRPRTWRGSRARPRQGRARPTRPASSSRRRRLRTRAWRASAATARPRWGQGHARRGGAARRLFPRRAIAKRVTEQLEPARCLEASGHHHLGANDGRVAA